MERQDLGTIQHVIEQLKKLDCSNVEEVEKTVDDCAETLSRVAEGMKAYLDELEHVVELD
jgi:hypothetical protein